MWAGVISLVSAALAILLWYLKSRSPKSKMDEALKVRREANARTAQFWYSMTEGRLEKIEDSLGQLNDHVDILRRMRGEIPAKSSPERKNTKPE